MELELLGVSESLVEGDSKVVLGWALGSNCPWIYLDKIERIRRIIASFEFKVAWVPWSVNTAADVLAHQGSSLASEVVIRVL